MNVSADCRESRDRAGRRAFSCGRGCGRALLDVLVGIGWVCVGSNRRRLQTAAPLPLRPRASRFEHVMALLSAKSDDQRHRRVTFRPGEAVQQTDDPEGLDTEPENPKNTKDRRRITLSADGFSAETHAGAA